MNVLTILIQSQWIASIQWKERRSLVQILDAPLVSNISKMVAGTSATDMVVTICVRREAVRRLSTTRSVELGVSVLGTAADQYARTQDVSHRSSTTLAVSGVRVVGRPICLDTGCKSRVQYSAGGIRGMCKLHDGSGVCIEIGCKSTMSYKDCASTQEAQIPTAAIGPAGYCRVQWGAYTVHVLWYPSQDACDLYGSVVWSKSQRDAQSSDCRLVLLS
jgi:hypothetical protein